MAGDRGNRTCIHVIAIQHIGNLPRSDAERSHQRSTGRGKRIARGISRIRQIARNARPQRTQSKTNFRREVTQGEVHAKILPVLPKETGIALTSRSVIIIARPSVIIFTNWHLAIVTRLNNDDLIIKQQPISTPGMGLRIREGITTHARQRRVGIKAESLPASLPLGLDAQNSGILVEARIKRRVKSARAIKRLRLAGIRVQPNQGIIVIDFNLGAILTLLREKIDAIHILRSAIAGRRIKNGENGVKGQLGANR